MYFRIEKRVLITFVEKCILDPEDEVDKKQQLFHTYSGLGDNAENLNHHLTALKASLAATSSNQSDRLDML